MLKLGIKFMFGINVMISLAGAMIALSRECQWGFIVNMLSGTICLLVIILFTHHDED